MWSCFLLLLYMGSKEQTGSQDLHGEHFYPLTYLSALGFFIVCFSFVEIGFMYLEWPRTYSVTQVGL